MFDEFWQWYYFPTQWDNDTIFKPYTSFNLWSSSLHVIYLHVLQQTMYLKVFIFYHMRTHNISFHRKMTGRLSYAAKIWFLMMLSRHRTDFFFMEFHQQSLSHYHHLLLVICILTKFLFHASVRSKWWRRWWQWWFWRRRKSKRRSSGTSTKEITDLNSFTRTLPENFTMFMSTLFGSSA